MQRLYVVIPTAFISVICMGQKFDNSTVRELDLNRYLGNWYEIARFDHVFERGLTHAQAHYYVSKDGSILVTNSGLKNDKFKSSKGRIKLTDEPGRLRVSFFGPFYSDYRVLMLDADYQFALVGSKNAKYLWILSRTPKMSDLDLWMVLNEARRRGYDTDDLIWVEQSPTSTVHPAATAD